MPFPPIIFHRSRRSLPISGLTSHFDFNDIGTLYNTSTSGWTPPAGLVQINASIDATVASGGIAENITLKILRDSTVIATASVPEGTGTSYRAGGQISVVDNASGSNVYTVKMSATAAAVVQTTSTFSGATF